jgi:hypothetical protein
MVFAFPSARAEVMGCVAETFKRLVRNAIYGVALLPALLRRTSFALLTSTVPETVTVDQTP